MEVDYFNIESKKLKYDYFFLFSVKSLTDLLKKRFRCFYGKEENEDMKKERNFLINSLEKFNLNYYITSFRDIWNFSKRHFSVNALVFYLEFLVENAALFSPTILYKHPRNDIPYTLTSVEHIYNLDIKKGDKRFYYWCNDKNLHEYINYFIYRIIFEEHSRLHKIISENKNINLFPLSLSEIIPGKNEDEISYIKKVKSFVDLFLKNLKKITDVCSEEQLVRDRAVVKLYEETLIEIKHPVEMFQGFEKLKLEENTIDSKESNDSDSSNTINISNDSNVPNNEEKNIYYSLESSIKDEEDYVILEMSTDEKEDMEEDIRGYIEEAMKEDVEAMEE